MLFNQWFGAGRLGREPEMSYTNTGKAVTKFSIAVDQGKDQPAMWLNIVCWERIAERINEQARKGSEVFVQGRLVTRAYDDKNGVKRTSLEVVATSVQLTQPPKVMPDAEEGDALGDLDDHPF